MELDGTQRTRPQPRTGAQGAPFPGTGPAMRAVRPLGDAHADCTRLGTASRNIRYRRGRNAAQ